MTRKRILFGHEVEGIVEFFLRHFPCDERAVRELGREQGLAHAADHAGFDHRADALQHGVERHTGFFGDHMKWLTLKSGDEIFRNRENGGVDRIVVFDGNGGAHG